MHGLWLNIAAIVEFVGTLIISGFIAQATYALIRKSSISHVRLLVARGAITGLDFKLAATLLKVLTLLQWHQIGMFAAVYGIRFVLKQAFLAESTMASRANREKPRLTGHRH